MTDSQAGYFEQARRFTVAGALILAFCLAAAMAAPAQTFTTLVNFNGTNGAAPVTSLVQGRDGKYYGTASEGGTNSQGTIFKVTAAGKLTTVYNFCSLANCADGAVPVGGLVLAYDGNLYGVTEVNGSGTIYKVTPGGVLTTLYTFCTLANCADGSQPLPLVQGTDGDFYGTTYEGGANGSGTVFKMTPSGKLTTLHSFGSGGTDGASPDGALAQAPDGNFYGTTFQGGSTGNGTFFKITPSGDLTTLYSFCPSLPCPSGDGPMGSLVQAGGGSFYGTTVEGGTYTYGTLFKITPKGKLAITYVFCKPSCDDGVGVQGVIQGTDGNFYGEAGYGGNSCDWPGCGTLLEVTPKGVPTMLHGFAGSDGDDPSGTLLQATNGNFYGTTRGGGTSGSGTVFSLSMGLGPFVAFVHDSGKVGANVQILGQRFTGTTGVSFNGTAANFVVRSDTYLTATVPGGATTGYVTVTTPSGTVQSNVVFHVRN